MNTFLSDADLIRHYAKEFMRDGNPHSVADIVKYIHQTHGEMGVTGERLDYRNIGSAFHNLIIMDKGDYVKVRRGVYKMLPPSEKHAIKTICGKVSVILAGAERDVRACIANNLMITEVPTETLQAFQATARTLFSLLEQAAQAIDTFAREDGSVADGEEAAI